MLTLPQANVRFLIQLLMIDHSRSRTATVSPPLQIWWWQSRRQSHDTVGLICIEGFRGVQSDGRCMLLHAVIIAASCASLVVIELLDKLDDTVSPGIKGAGPCHICCSIFNDLVGAENHPGYWRWWVCQSCHEVVFLASCESDRGGKAFDRCIEWVKQRRWSLDLTAYHLRAGFLR